MNRYTIPCTEEQTKKAFELGAPITQHPFHESVIKGNERLFENIININGKYYCLPTAEQIIGWLEEQNIYIHIDTCSKKPVVVTYRHVDITNLDMSYI